MILAGMCWAVVVANLSAAGALENPYTAEAVRCAANPYLVAYEHLRFANPYRSETTWRAPRSSGELPVIPANPYRSEPGLPADAPPQEDALRDTSIGGHAPAATPHGGALHRGEESAADDTQPSPPQPLPASPAPTATTTAPDVPPNPYRF